MTKRAALIVLAVALAATPGRAQTSTSDWAAGLANDLRVAIGIP